MSDEKNYKNLDVWKEASKLIIGFIKYLEK
jgi:hypothetical protein